MEALLIFAEKWGMVGVLLVVGFAWLYRVETALRAHEAKCSERYSIIFERLGQLRNDVATLLERTSR